MRASPAQLTRFARPGVRGGDVDETITLAQLKPLYSPTFRLRCGMGIGGWAVYARAVTLFRGFG